MSAPVVEEASRKGRGIERRHECPVCRRILKPTVHQNIPSHFDSIRSDVCPASGEPYRIMLERQPEFVGVVA